MSTDILPLLAELIEAGQIYAQSNRGQLSEARLYQALAGAAGQAFSTVDELKSAFRSDAAFSTVATKRFIRLADTSDGAHAICPVIFLDGDLSKNHPYLRIQLIIVTHSLQADVQPQCLLMRFETPEGMDPEGQGKHDYYHSQLCTELRVDSSGRTLTVPKCVQWSAASCPAWPVDAGTPFQLLACVVFALYGKFDGVRILRKAYGKSLDALIEEMHFVFAKPQASMKSARRAPRSRPGPKR
ncbi:hypothetical protein I6F09_17170 [Bradyrhizobium sp. IC3195]|uniref:hypothetical protein n=1 Tax=Bradyrhizobium sp. IC3195 TaxID=2793804 RepID=UPI001CD4B9D8|nr:hypothetical protein [Bradyrhizobium sp. IC3195]MCA1469628.1 hypothetical protein [Bradyrhizobium sp. IC3195]